MTEEEWRNSANTEKGNNKRNYSRPPEPVFAVPPNSIQVKRVLHSEAYVKYIESLYANPKQKTVSKWDKSLQANQRNTTIPNHKKLPYDWIRHAAGKRKAKLNQ